jgi:hypothetical protein
MKLKTIARLALLSTLSLCAIVGCSSADGAVDAPASDAQDVVSSREIRATNKPEHAMLPSVFGIRQVNDSLLALRIYETGGGDVAMNGNQLWLSAMAESGETRVFNLGLNINTLDSTLTSTEVVSGGTLLKIGGSEDVLDENGGVVVQPFEATVKLSTPDGPDGVVIAPKVTVTKKGDSADVAAATDPAGGYLGSVYRMTQEAAGNSNHVGRVFLRSGGDPAMNGVSVLFSISNSPETRTFDLGLNIADVSALKMQSAFEFRLEGSEDVMGASGNIEPKPFAYSIKFTIGADGRPADVVKLTKLPR